MFRATSNLCRTALVTRSQCAPIVRAFGSHSFVHAVTPVAERKNDLFKTMTGELETMLAKKEITKELYDQEINNLNTEVKNGTFPQKSEPSNYVPKLSSMTFEEMQKLMNSPEAEKMSSYDFDYYLNECLARKKGQSSVGPKILIFSLLLAWPFTQTLLKKKFERDYPDGHYGYSFPWVEKTFFK